MQLYGVFERQIFEATGATVVLAKNAMYADFVENFRSTDQRHTKEFFCSGINV
jgi:hypothetical protein